MGAFVTRRNRLGFSLLELSVSLAVIALVAGFGVSLSSDIVNGTKRVTTQQRLITIRQALDAYVQRNGYLPCPAKRSDTTGVSSFGLEQRFGAVCNLAAPGLVQDTGGTIYIGAVPTTSLGLAENYMADGWNQKFLYAVSIAHTAGIGSYATIEGPITVKHGDLTTSYDIITGGGAGNWGATYVVLSHGPDRKGAYPIGGTTAPIACGAITAGNRIDNENCNTAGAIFFDSEYNDGTQNASFFDDYIIWGSNAGSRRPDAYLNNTTAMGPATAGLGALGVNSQGCAPGVCEAWCAPCLNLPLRVSPTVYVCQSSVVSYVPCKANCVYAYLGGGVPNPCP